MYMSTKWKWSGKHVTSANYIAFPLISTYNLVGQRVLGAYSITLDLYGQRIYCQVACHVDIILELADSIRKRVAGCVGL
jgi:hypothetical protein